MRNVMWLLLYSFLCGLCLAMFTQTPSLLKYAFSIGAFLIGLRFFRKFETLRMRIVFVVVSIVMFLVILIVYVLIAVARGYIQVPQQV